VFRFIRRTSASARTRLSKVANSTQQVTNVRGESAVTDAPLLQACLPVDDIRFSSWTLAMVAGQLRRRGAGPVHPLALSTAF
jgi:ATP-dependent DNA helicase RecQ